MIYRVDSDGPTCWVISTSPQAAINAVRHDAAVGISPEDVPSLRALALDDTALDATTISDDSDGCSRTLRAYLRKHAPGSGVFACSEWT